MNTAPEGADTSSGGGVGIFGLISRLVGRAATNGTLNLLLLRLWDKERCPC